MRGLVMVVSVAFSIMTAAGRLLVVHAEEPAPPQASVVVELTYPERCLLGGERSAGYDSRMQARALSPQQKAEYVLKVRQYLAGHQLNKTVMRQLEVAEYLRLAKSPDPEQIKAYFQQHNEFGCSPDREAAYQKGLADWRPPVVVPLTSNELELLDPAARAAYDSQSAPYMPGRPDYAPAHQAIFFREYRRKFLKSLGPDIAPGYSKFVEAPDSEAIDAALTPAPATPAPALDPAKDLDGFRSLSPEEQAKVCRGGSSAPVAQTVDPAQAASIVVNCAHAHNHMTAECIDGARTPSGAFSAGLSEAVRKECEALQAASPQGSAAATPSFLTLTPEPKPMMAPPSPSTGTGAPASGIWGKLGSALEWLYDKLIRPVVEFLRPYVSPITTPIIKWGKEVLP